MKKVFILTGEPSGDKLASKVINDLKKINQKIEYLSNLNFFSCLLACSYKLN